jgi:hypothetical protein
MLYVVHVVTLISGTIPVIVGPNMCFPSQQTGFGRDWD